MPDQPTSPRANSWRNRVRYRFDNLLSHGTWVVLLWLGLVTVAAVLLAAVLLAVAGVTFSSTEGGSFVEGFWQSLMRTMDPGTMADDVGWGRRIVALAVTTVGILIAGTLIGLIANGIEQRMTQMQRGRSVVVETGHAVVLGASDRLPIVIEQLVFANIGRRKSAIVVLAEREPAELSQMVRSVVPDTKGSRLVFRWGDPTRPADLRTVAIQDARTVIVLADEGARDDAGAVKAVLAAKVAMGQFDGRSIVVDLSDPASAEALVRACGEAVQPVVVVRTVARTALFALREPGLNQVVEELVDYRGADIYLTDPAGLVGRSFGDLVDRSAMNRPIGRVRSTGEVELAPDPATKLESGDRLVIIADSELNLEVGLDEPLHRAATQGGERFRVNTAPREEHVLVVGWNALGVQLVEELHRATTPESTIEIVYDSRLLEPEDIAVTESGVTLTPARTDMLQLSDISQTQEFTTIVILGYRRGVSVEEADSRTLLTNMLVRRDLEARPGPAPRVLVELIDADNVPLARMTGADDFLASDAIASRFVVQLAEQPERRSVLLSLYEADGASVHLVPAAEIGLHGDVDGGQVVSAALAVGLLAIGWRRSLERGGRVVLNPHRDERIKLESGDQIVVIA